MIQEAKLLINYRDLFYIWTIREIKIRYKQSILGGAWAILQPLSLMLIFTVVFSYLVRVPSEGIPYPLFAYAGLLLWSFLTTGINFGVPSLVNNMGLLTKIYFPREILPVAAVCASLVDFLIGFVFFMILFLFYGAHIYIMFLWLPIILLAEIMLVIGIVLIGSALNVFYRDVRFIIPLFTQLWFYASPVIYPLEVVPEWLQPYYALNPMVGILDSFRKVMLHNQAPSLPILFYSFIISMVLMILGLILFKRVEWKFADVI